MSKKETEAHKETHNKLINTQRIMNEIPFRIFSKKLSETFRAE